MVIMSAVPREVSEPNFGNIIDRILRDTSIPPERIATVCEYLVAAGARKEFYTAWPAMQAALPTVARTGMLEMPGRKGRSYATLDDLISKVRNIMNAHGFGVRSEFRYGDGTLTAIVHIVHRGGHVERTEFPVEYDKGPGRNAAQAIGSARTYALRYAFTAALMIGSADDDDGEAAGPTAEEIAPVTEQQAQIIAAGLHFAGADEARFCSAWKIRKLTELHAVDFPKALAALRRRLSEEDAKEFEQHIADTVRGEADGAKNT
jgi:hypothetical protein